MSEVTKPFETTPGPAVVGGTDSTPLPSTTPAVTNTESTPATGNVNSPTETATAEVNAETTGTGEAKVEVTHADEGILGYKGPGLIQ